MLSQDAKSCSLLVLSLGFVTSFTCCVLVGFASAVPSGMTEYRRLAQKMHDRPTSHHNKQALRDMDTLHGMFKQQQSRQRRQAQHHPSLLVKRNDGGSENRLASTENGSAGAVAAVQQQQQRHQTPPRPSRLTKKQAEDPDPTVQHERILKHLRDLHNLQLQHAAHQQFEDKQVEERQRMQMRQQQELEEMQTRQLTQIKKHVDIMQAMIDQHMKDQKTLQLAQQKERDTLRIRQQAQLREVLKEKVKNKAQQEHMQRQMEVEQLKRLQQERLRLHEKEVGLEKMRLMQQGKLPDPVPLLQSDSKQSEVQSKTELSQSQNSEMNKASFGLVLDIDSPATNTNNPTHITTSPQITTPIPQHVNYPTLHKQITNNQGDAAATTTAEPAAGGPAPGPVRASADGQSGPMSLAERYMAPPGQPSAPSSSIDQAAAAVAGMMQANIHQHQHDQQQNNKAALAAAHQHPGHQHVLKQSAGSKVKDDQEPRPSVASSALDIYRLGQHPAAGSSVIRRSSVNNNNNLINNAPPEARPGQQIISTGAVSTAVGGATPAATTPQGGLSQAEEDEAHQAAMREAGLRVEEKSTGGAKIDRLAQDTWKQATWMT